MKHLFLSLLTVCTCMLTISCTLPKTIVPAEALQIPEFAKVYTAYNIWYTNPEKIDCLNVQQGTLLPFGTEIEFLDANTQYVRFKSVKDHKVYQLNFDSNIRQMSMADFLRTVFTTKNPTELEETIRPVVIEKIKRGIVDQGMSKDEVVLAFGPPASFYTPTLADDTWIYFINNNLTIKRLIFMNGILIEIIML